MLIHIPQVGLKEIRPGQIIESVEEMDFPYLKELKEAAPTKRKYNQKQKDIVDGKHRNTENNSLGKLRSSGTNIRQPNGS